MIFYDFEVFEKDWLAVFIDVTKKKEHVIINSPDKLKALYEANRKDIWVGFNNRHYDQYIMKGIIYERYGWSSWIRLYKGKRDCQGWGIYRIHYNW